MKTHSILSIISMCFILGCATQKPISENSTVQPPDYVLGTFEDDYEIQYSVTDSVFILLPNDIYHIKKWDVEQQFLIAHNDSANAYDPGKWTRIDWIKLENMSPFEWAFCLSVFKAESAEVAESSAEINPDTPRTGCNGFPYSRMKRVASPDSTQHPYN